jgi:hypothetical protein
LAACAYQIYLGIYLGYFLIICLLPFGAIIFIYRRKWLAVHSFLGAATARSVTIRGLSYGGLAVAFLAILLPLAISYYEVQEGIGRRSWEEIVPMLPRWQSYLYAPLSIFWGGIFRFGESLPAAGEHMLFIGFLPCLGIGVLAYLLTKGKLAGSESTLSLAMIGVLFCSWGLTFHFFGFSLYRWVWTFLPGAGGIRGVTRIMLVLIYPVTFILGLCVTHGLNSRLAGRTTWGRSIFGLVILALLIVDQSAEVPSMSTAECLARVEKLKSRIGDSRQPVLWLNDTEGEHYVVRHLDAMLVGQDLGLNVVNGYSSLPPNGFTAPLFTLSGDICTAIAVWARTHPFKIAKQNLLQLGESCEIPDHDYLPTPMRGFSGVDTSKAFHAWVISRSAELGLPYLPGEEGVVTISFDLSTLNPRSVKISQPDGMTQTIKLIPGQPRHLELRLVRWTGSSQAIP